MKKLFLFVILVFLFCCVNAQQINREGNVFSIEKTVSSQDTIKTVFAYKDSQGNIYPIWLNKKSGACFIFKTSKKTGKIYRQYMSAEIKENVCTYYNITIKTNEDEVVNQ